MHPAEASDPISLSSGSHRLQLKHRDHQSRTRRRLVERAHEDIAGPSDQRIEHHGRLSFDDFPDDVIDRGLAKLEQALSEDAAAGAGHDFPDDPVGLPGPDIVGADAEHVAGNVFEHMPHQRHDGVIGRRADIDHVVAAFEPLISCRMPEQPFGAFDDRNDLLARRRGIAADDMLDLLFANEVVACGMVGGDDAAGIAPVRRKAEIELLALIDLIDRHQRALLHLARHHGVGAGSGKDETEWDRRLGHRQGSGVAGSGHLTAITVDLSPVIADRDCASFGLPGIKKCRPLIDKPVGAKTQSPPSYVNTCRTKEFSRSR